MFCDLRDSTDILSNFEQGKYGKHTDGGHCFTYEKFIFDVHKTSYEYLYLGHNKTHTEIYGDGLMAIFPEDNTNYILENIYSLTKQMRVYNDSEGVGVVRPSIDMGFGITVADITLVYYYLDQRYHPIGMGVHEAARIEGVSKFYDARVLISERFFHDTVAYIDADPRFSYRFIDRVCLKNFHEPVSLYEILVDNDPRFDQKIRSVPLYSEAYDKYCAGDWQQARELFLRVYHDYGLGTGLVMANRCELLVQHPPQEWCGVWSLQDK
ncbi:adenylate/guanylate cyclase domain-containing protein [Mariprofundus erugo]|uniref:Adenylate/guanylate cyclase domain-containing protein n=2 Tax=Mariprofundus erugo TaxID=2528639 RepID=A0A5R9GWB2_9PROT|nr:adenylate/guanylate cyclase domain-containing protein [Mariprofundus erugo]TLS76547.1 adenylate/guanylate cyclase domain-containing protein [Mariprofundus erugo]